MRNATKKHGYPPGWIPGFKSKGRQHERFNFQANTTTTSSGSAAQMSNDVGISPEQFHKLFSMLQHHNSSQNHSNGNVVVAISKLALNFKGKGTVNTQGKYNSCTSIDSLTKLNESWILYTGATNHITCNLDYFDDYEPVNGLVVNMPNGGTISVEFVGNIRLTSEIVLHSVFYIPTFNFNILSASQLTKDST